MDWVQVSAIFEVVGGVCGAISLLGTLYLKSNFVTRSTFILTVEKQNERISTCERKHDKAASSSEMANLTLTVADLSGNLKELKEGLRGMSLAFDRQSNAVDRIETHLMNKASP